MNKRYFSLWNGEVEELEIYWSRIKWEDIDLKKITHWAGELYKFRNANGF